MKNEVGKLAHYVRRARRHLRVVVRDIQLQIRERSFEPYVISAYCEGENFKFYVGNLTGREWYELEDHSFWPEMGFIRDHLIKPGGLIVDCGAHHGFSTILLARWTGPTGKVFAFEANPVNVSIVRANLELNGIANVELFEKPLVAGMVS